MERKHCQLDELGNVKSTDFGSKEVGFNLLNTPDEIYNNLRADGFWEQCNKPWLNNAVERNDIIVLATEPAKEMQMNKNADKRIKGDSLMWKNLDDNLS